MIFFFNFIVIFIFIVNRYANKYGESAPHAKID